MLNAKPSSFETPLAPLAWPAHRGYMAAMAQHPVEIRRKRLKFRSHRRGFREVDLVFSTFAEAELAGLSEAEMDQFEALLAAPDQEVWLWLQDKAPTPPEFDTPVFARLKALCARANPDWPDWIF